MRRLIALTDVLLPGDEAVAPGSPFHVPDDQAAQLVALKGARHAALSEPPVVKALGKDPRAVFAKGDRAFFGPYGVTPNPGGNAEIGVAASPAALSDQTVRVRTFKD